MESFVSRYKNALVLIVVLVAQLLALAVQVKRPAADAADPREVSLIRYVVVSVITPPERLLHNIGLGIRGIWLGYLDLVHVRQQNADLKTEMERLRLEQASVAEDAKQGQRLQQLLGFKERYIYKTLPAQVIGTAGTEQSRILYIDKGSKDGLEPEMPVVTADGVVGKLKDVFPHISQVLEISDTTSGVGALLQTTRIRGVLKGSSVGEVQMINVSPDERIKPGEIVLTSGGDQIFPRGLPVGTVERVQTDPDRDPLLDVIVRPAANLSRLEEVLVITNLGDETPKQEIRDLAESEAEGLAAQKRASDVLSERLPAKVDPNAPADTNPQNLVDDAGNAIRPLSPPKPLHADQFSPNATPAAAEMTPGQRQGAIKEGTEEVAARPAAKPKPASDTASGNGIPGTETAVKKTAVSTAATASAGSGGTSGTSGTAIPVVHKPLPTVDASGAVTAATRRPTPSVSADGTTTVVVRKPASSVDAAGTVTPAVHRAAPLVDGTGTAAVPHRTIQPADGSVSVPTARTASQAPSSTSPPRALPSTVPGSTVGSTRTAATGTTSASPSASSASRFGNSEGAPATGGGLKPESKTRVIVDGPVVPAKKKTPDTASPGTPVKASPTTPVKASPTPGAPVKAPSAPVKKGPILVPDDGSRPPSAEKPKPAAQSSEPASTPQRGPN